mmetsp:Transcript_17260/g.37779  ORF Transcript_17260/g.37779 Transcript_17260/m.37779 type:complete len:82 (+) Transcript_17260:581-826(+)
MTDSMAAAPPASTVLWPINGKQKPVKIAAINANIGSSREPPVPQQLRPRKGAQCMYFHEREPRLASSTKHVKMMPPRVQSF